jgi:maltoporin
LKFHGYFRSGYGLNSRAGRQVAFQAPGADAKFRLGNEAETYGELIFVNNWLNPEHNSDSAWMKAQLMVEGNTTNSASYANFSGGIGNDQFRLREAFIQAGNIFKSQPTPSSGRGTVLSTLSGTPRRLLHPRHERLRRRHGGCRREDRKVSVAYLGGSRPDVATQYGNYAKSNIDVRLYDINAPGGKREFGSILRPLRAEQHKPAP